MESPHTRSIASEATEIEAAVNSKDLERADHQDRLSNLPDEILSLILEGLTMHEAARTTVLSRRWVHLFGQRSTIILNIKDFHSKGDQDSEIPLDDVVKSNTGLIQATKSMLLHTCQHSIRILGISFYLMEESIDIVRSVDKAMTNRRVTSLHFVICPEIVDVHCTQDHMISYGRLFMRLLGAGPRAFGGLSYLHIRCVELSIEDMTSVLNACNNLEHLHIQMCDFGFQFLMEIEHPRLVTLTFTYCIFGTVELRWLPRLTRFTCDNWVVTTTTMNQQYPISFGYVPKLSMLILRNPATIHHKTIQLSKLLNNNVMISELDLDFIWLRVWIQPEAPKFVGHVLQNLQILYLRSIHEECDLDWTMFFLEAAPLLKKIHVQVWDPQNWGHGEDESLMYIQDCEQLYQKRSDYLSWQTPNDLKHYYLKELIVLGYQAEDKLTRYIRRMVKAAVKLERVILTNTHSCKRKFSPPTRVLGTTEQRDMMKKQISEWASSPIEIKIG